MHCLHWLVANIRISQQYISFRVKHCLCFCIRMYHAKKKLTSGSYWNPLAWKEVQQRQIRRALPSPQSMRLSFAKINRTTGSRGHSPGRVLKIESGLANFFGKSGFQILLWGVKQLIVWWCYMSKESIIGSTGNILSCLHIGRNQASFVSNFLCDQNDASWMRALAPRGGRATKKRKLKTNIQPPEL